MKIDAAMFGSDLSQSGRDALGFEERGFDGVMSFEGQHDPFVPLILAAQTTQRVELMTAIAIAFARNPMVTAVMASDLQLVSHGRFILGLGSQIRPHIERRFSERWPEKPATRMREYVSAVRAIWHTWETGERLSFKGEFYNHTLMTPFFNPGPNPYGLPRIFLAAFGKGMIRATAEVADGWIVHPLHSPSFIREVAMPALEAGFANGDRKREDFEISCQVITMIGSKDEEIEKARNGARAQLAFYGSTPAYKIVLEHHGWEDLQPQLNRLSKEGRWSEMGSLITDEILDTVGVSGTPCEAGEKLRLRNASFAARTSMVLYNETDPEALDDVLAGLRG
ncbi:MAG: TIGR03617 family F420-dependent LLM class oxidoreductase [bacterium]|nr:TIGR03617 family F420-dependent LLM class oxidoreductase [bacterium]